MIIKKIFPSYQLNKVDYFIGGVFLAFCWVLFVHVDIWILGLDSLSYLFGSPLEFYENCQKVHDGITWYAYEANYPPTIYAITALWLYPLKLLGLLTNPNNFPFNYVYWLKVLTSIVYAASGVVFYKITKIYSDDIDWRKYATAIWLTTPLAVFSQFIFSQHDIFCVFLTLVGFLMFLRGGLLAATICFGIAITFKYFPAFVFIPLLLLFEKKILRLAILFFIFFVPTLVIQLLYGQSEAFINGVTNFGIIERIYAASIDMGGWKIYYLFASFTILCGWTYLSEYSKERLPYIAAYVFLVAAILPFLFIFWHPQWVIFCTPAMVLTTLIDKRCEKFLVLDLIGMVFFVAAISLVFPNNADVAAMFRGGNLLGIDFDNSYKMAGIFYFFKEHSASVFLSAFWGYLVTQIILKFKPMMQVPGKTIVNYKNVRQRFYIGLLIFIIPAFFVTYKNHMIKDRFIINEVAGMHYGELLKQRVFEQVFTAKAGVLEEVDLLLSTFARKNSGTIILEITNSNNKILAKIEKSIESIKDNSWQKFKFDPVYLSKDGIYKLKLTSPSGKHGDAVTWWSSPNRSYQKGKAIIDGISQNTSFGFIIKFGN